MGFFCLLLAILSLRLPLIFLCSKKIKIDQIGLPPLQKPVFLALKAGFEALPSLRRFQDSLVYHVVSSRNYCTAKKFKNQVFFLSTCVFFCSTIYIIEDLVLARQGKSFADSAEIYYDCVKSVSLLRNKY